MALCLTPVLGMPRITAESKLAPLLLARLAAAGEAPATGDLLVFAHKIVSKQEGRTVPLCSVVPSPLALQIAGQAGKDPALVQLVCEESDQVVAAGRGILIARQKDGWVCANAGIDHSNTEPGTVVLLPRDADASAKALSEELFQLTGVRMAVLVSDTHGRALRNGITGVCVGSYGLSPLKSYRGVPDLLGNELQVSIEAVADELCGAATLLMGQAGEGIPAVLVRGYPYEFSETGCRALVRGREQQIFQPEGTIYDTDQA